MINVHHTGASPSLHCDLGLKQFSSLMAGAPIHVNDEFLATLDQSARIAEICARTEQTYGFSTGFGPMVTCDILREHSLDLQYNLIRSHAAGMGDALSPDISRGVLIARLRSLLGNRSGVSGNLVRHIVGVLNAGIAPFIPRKGGVGASGDLVQLAHAALLIIGEGFCWYEGEVSDTRVILQKLDLRPYELRFRDGLALVNGTSGMVAVGAKACWDAARLFKLAILMSAMIADIIDANKDAYSEELNSSKRNLQQNLVADAIRSHLGQPRNKQAATLLQAPYSIRCAPQIIGPMLEAQSYAERIIVDELNSVSDNPIFDPASGKAFHGGNFHGEAAAQAIDFLKISIVKCSLLMERQLNLLCNDAINNKLPPFVNLGRPGIDLGMQGAQFTATSTAAENQSLAFPVSVHSLPSNKDNQDVVSMGFNAGHICLQALDNAFDIAAILAMAISQAYAHKRTVPPSADCNALVEAVRAISPPFCDDRILAGNLAQISQVLRRVNSFLDGVATYAGRRTEGCGPGSPGSTP